jgi:hypothetical protein
MKDFQEYNGRPTHLFWTDARKELGYDKLFAKEGVQALENHAWQEGHSAGFSEVWGYLVDLVELAKILHESSRVSP